MQINVYAEETQSAEAKVYSEATLEDEFAEDRVLVVLNNEASLAADQYETSVFSGINCGSVKNLTQAKEMAVQEKLSNISAELEELATARNMIELATTADVMEIAAADEELSSYNQVLCIKLEESGKDKVLEMIAALEKQEDILYAGPDYVISACSTTTDDTYYSEQWALDMLNLPEAWDITTGSSSVTVAVLDTGIDGDHPDLMSRINTSLCRDFTINGDVSIGTPTDDNGHGTFVAGIIGAIGNNGTGIAGTCWRVKLVSLKILIR